LPPDSGLSAEYTNYAEKPPRNAEQRLPGKSDARNGAASTSKPICGARIISRITRAETNAGASKRSTAKAEVACTPPAECRSSRCTIRQTAPAVRPQLSPMVPWTRSPSIDRWCPPKRPGTGRVDYRRSIPWVRASRPTPASSACRRRGSALRLCP
jgi:hypothetical protein